MKRQNNNSLKYKTKTMKTLLKNQILILAILSIFLLGTGGCNNDDDAFVPSLPPITQTGENTFGCYVDGKLLIPRDGTAAIPPNKGMLMWASSESSPYHPYHDLRVRDHKSGNGAIFNLHITGLGENWEGTHTINESNCEEGGYALPSINLYVRWRDEETQSFKWYCSIENGGTLTILRHDVENGIISGTFNSTVVNQDNSDEFIEITEGRFDIHTFTLQHANFP